MAVKIHCLVAVLLQASAVIFPGAQSSGECEDDWMYFNGSCYDINGRIGSAFTWHRANGYCLDRGAQLASVHSQEENRFIAEKGFLKYHPTIWLGLTSLGDDQRIYWTDGSPLTFSRVNVSVVDSSRRCAALDSPSPEKRWLFMHCDVEGSFVCKRSPKDKAQTLTPPATTPWPGSCQPDWTRIGNKCFKIFGSKESERVNHSVALERCKSLGPNYNLASVHSDQENVILTTLAAREETNVWLGLSRITFTTFGWTDNTALGYTNWAPGEPSSVAEGCTEFITSKHRAGLWNDISCRAQMAYLCQAHPDAGSTEVPPIADACENKDFVKFGSSCYKVESEQSVSWSAAESRCLRTGGHLASIHSASEAAFLRSQLQSLDVRGRLWTGLTTDQNGKFRWSDGWPVTFLNLASALNQSASHCGYLDLNGTWSLGQCQQALGYVCKVTKETVPDFPKFDSRPCPKHVPDWLDVGLGHCFRVSRDYAAFGSAAFNCIRNDSQLASFQHQHELDLLAPYVSMSKVPYWIGKYRKHDGNFVWLDGSLPKNPELDLWESGEPSAKKEEDCVDLNPVSLLTRAKNCGDGSHLYICKIAKA